MIPSVLAVLIYQILAILGVDAVAQIVTYIAYRRRDLDTKLMYAQSPLDLIYNYNKFKKSTAQKAKIIAFVTLALTLGFIPTILTKLSSNGYIYYDIIETPLQKNDTIANKTAWPPSMSIFNNFTPYLQYTNDSAISDMLTDYLQQNLRQNTTSNPTGVWYGVKAKPTYKYNNMQYGDERGFFIHPDGEGSDFTTFIAFKGRPGDSYTQKSSSLETCSGFYNGLSSLGNRTNAQGFVDDVYGQDVIALREARKPCYPFYDQGASIYATGNQTARLSVLSRSDTFYRTSILNPGVTASGSFAVSLYNHNKTHMSMGIKKMASITIYNYDNNVTAPTDCSDTNKYNNSVNFKDLPYNAILCNMYNFFYNDTYIILQATGKHFNNSNHAVNSVYTIQGDRNNEPGQKVMIDLTMLAVYNLEGQMGDDNEHLLAFKTSNIGALTKADKSIQPTLANDNIGHILYQLDPSVINKQTLDVLVAIASMRARWTNNDYSDFVKISAKVMDAVETPNWWIITVIVLFVVFLLPQLLRLKVRRIPHYGYDLRTIWISSLEDNKSASWKGDFEPKHIQLLAVPSGDEGKVVRLKVNGALVTKSKDSEESSLIND